MCDVFKELVCHSLHLENLILLFGLDSCDLVLYFMANGV